MLVTQSSEWGEIISSVPAGTRPAAAMGTSITPGNNVYGSYAQLIAGASVTSDAFGILINFNSNATSASARDAIATVGLDQAGGTSYTDFISDLLCSSAAEYTAIGGIWYYFPVFIRSGTSIAVKASVNDATVGTMHSFVRLYCKPSRPETIRCGSYVTTFGSTTASSSGTAVTPGTAADGAWTQIGSALTRPHWFWQVGLGINDATQVGNAYDVDVGIGDATNKRVVITDQAFIGNSTEKIGNVPYFSASADCAANDIVYARAQAGAGAADSGVSVAVYAVGG